MYNIINTWYRYTLKTLSLNSK